MERFYIAAHNSWLDRNLPNLYRSLSNSLSYLFSFFIVLALLSIILELKLCDSCLVLDVLRYVYADCFSTMLWIFRRDHLMDFGITYVVDICDKGSIILSGYNIYLNQLCHTFNILSCDYTLEVLNSWTLGFDIFMWNYYFYLFLFLKYGRRWWIISSRIWSKSSLRNIMSF